MRNEVPQLFVSSIPTNCSYIVQDKGRCTFIPVLEAPAGVSHCADDCKQEDGHAIVDSLWLGIIYNI